MGARGPNRGQAGSASPPEKSLGDEAVWRKRITAYSHWLQYALRFCMCICSLRNSQEEQDKHSRKQERDSTAGWFHATPTALRFSRLE